MKNFLLLFLFFLLVKVNAQVISTVAGTTNGYSGDGGLAILASLNNPANLTFDANGNMYIADAANNRIRKIDPNGIITTIAGKGTYGYTGDGGLATLAELNYPWDVAVDKIGNVYISDQYNHCIRRVDTLGIISTIAGNGSAGYSGDGGAASSSALNLPAGIVLDSAGNLYICDVLNGRIRKVDTNGLINTIAGNGTMGFGGDGGQATIAMLNGPYGICMDKVNNIYIADTYNNRVRKIDTFGIINTLAGVGTAGFSGDGGQAVLAELDTLVSVAVDNVGNSYIADYNNNRIRKVDGSGIISTFAGNGTNNFSGDEGLAINAGFYVAALEFGPDADLYIADMYNDRVRRIDTCNLISMNFTLNQDVAPHVWDAYPNYSGNVTNAVWYWGDGTSTTGLYPSHTYTTAGWYNVCVTAFSTCRDSVSACQSDSMFRSNNSMITVNVLSGLSGISHIKKGEDGVSLYPNPSSISVAIQSKEKLGAILIYNSIGEIVFQTQSSSTKTEMDISKLPAGVYTVKAQSKYLRLVKE